MKNRVQKFHQPIDFLLKMKNQYQIDFFGNSTERGIFRNVMKNAIAIKKQQDTFIKNNTDRIFTGITDKYQF